MSACGRTDPHACRIGAHAPVPVCQHCGSREVIRGDGEMAFSCRACLRLLGTAVREPYAIPAPQRFDLLEAHLDVVDLLHGEWRWTASWATDARLIDGRIADGRLA